MSGAPRNETPVAVGEYESVPPDAPTSNGTWTPNSPKLRGGRTS